MASIVLIIEYDVRIEIVTNFVIRSCCEKKYGKKNIFVAATINYTLWKKKKKLREEKEIERRKKKL